MNSAYQNGLFALKNILSSYEELKNRVADPDMLTRQIEKTKKEYKNYIFSEIDKMLGKYDFDAANNALSELKKYVNDEDVADKGIDISNAELAYDFNKWADDFVAAMDDTKENEENLMNSYRDQQKVYISGKPQLQIVSNEKKLYLDVVNANSKATSTVYYSILEYDEFGNPITHDTVNEKYVNESVLKQEIRIEPNDVYSMKDSFIYISLHNSNTKYADVCVKKVVFEDGTSWVNPYYFYWVEDNNASYQWI